MRLVLFTGKGGVGTTTTAAATAVHAAACGVRVLLLSTDPGHSLGDVLGVSLTGGVRQMMPRLSVGHLDPRAHGERLWNGARRDIAEALDSLGVDPLDSADLADLPAAAELLSLLQVADLVDTNAWDVVVLDCAATMSALRLLALPDTLQHLVTRLLPMERRVARALQRTPLQDPTRATVLAPAPSADPRRDVVVETAEWLGALLERLRRMLGAPTTSVRLVLTPDVVVAAESRRTWTALALHGYAVDGVIANRLVPGDGADSWRLAWSRSQAEVLAGLRVAFAPVPVAVAGYARTEPVGLPALAALGAELYGQAVPGADSWLTATPERSPSPAVERDGTQFVLHLDLPLTERHEVDLRRRGPELVVDVGGERRVVPLPSALQRCLVVEARLRDGRLKVRFEPDPTLWRPW